MVLVAIGIELTLALLHGVSTLPAAALHVGLLVVVAFVAARARPALASVLGPPHVTPRRGTDGLDPLVALAAQLAGADAAVLLLPNDHGTLSVVATHGNVEVHGRAVPPHKGLVGACLAVGRPIRVTRVPEAASTLPYRTGTAAVSSAVCAPIVAPRGLGVLCLERHGDGSFPDDATARLAPFLALCARHLELSDGADSHQAEVGRSARHVAALRTMADARTEAAVTQQLRETARSLTGCEQAEWIEAAAVTPGSLAALSLEQDVPLPVQGLTRAPGMPLRAEGDPWTRNAGTAARAVPVRAPGGGDPAAGALGVLCLAGGPSGCLDDPAIASLGPLVEAAASALTRLGDLRSAELLAATDGLTGLSNRRLFDTELCERLRVAAVRGSHVALLLFDIDFFKRINDTYGHPAGDAVLRTVAATLREGVRQSDLAARYGGEEFAVILSGGNPNVAASLAERLRAAVAAAGMPVTAPDGPLRITISVGVASMTADRATPGALIEAADRALYDAKQGGRDRVVVA